MNAEERREARRKRILENSEIRLKRITTNEKVFNCQADQLENSSLNSELLDWPVLTSHKDNVIPIIVEDQPVFKYEPNHINPILHSRNVKYYEINISYVTILHIILSQIVLVLFYYDLGFVIGNSVVVPFMICAIPELCISKEQHGLHMVFLLMLGIPQNLANQISRCIELATITGRRFCVYIFCFTCSYAVLKYLYFDVKHNSFIT